MRLDIGQNTAVGQVRNHNEDSMAVFRSLNPDQREIKGDLFVVADGMGGHQAGEVASRYAVDRIIREYFRIPGADVQAALVTAVQAANSGIYEQGQGNVRRMGTTVVCAVVRGRDLYVANVGDSRAYLIHADTVQQISQDHSLVAAQARLGVLVQGEAMPRNVITRALGQKPEVQVDTFHRPLSPEDVLVLCSDGLTRYLDDEEIRGIAVNCNADEAARRLVAVANRRGGEDNITTIVVKVLGS